MWFYYKGQPVWTVCVIWIVEKPPHECRDSCSCSCRANCSLNNWEWPCRSRCGIAWLLSLGSVPVIPSLRRVPQVCCGHQPLCNLYFALLRIFSYFPLLDQAEGSWLVFNENLPSKNAGYVKCHSCLFFSESWLKVISGSLLALTSRFRPSNMPLIIGRYYYRKIVDFFSLKNYKRGKWWYMCNILSNWTLNYFQFSFFSCILFSNPNFNL